jgi:L-threonylcarbamoyladenylate synthase
MIGTDIKLAVKFLNEGKLVAIPTETVYGLAGNALDKDVVSQIFKTKNRPDFNPLILHLAYSNDIEKYAKSFPYQLQQLAEIYMPGPLSLLLDKREIVPDIVTAGSKKVAIRIPAHPLASHLLRLINYPLAAPSANPFGYVSPTSAQHVADQLGEKLPYILDGGECQVGIESTIVGVESGTVVVYRKGGLAIEAIETIVGSVIVKDHSDSNPSAPGMLSSHYAPSKKLIIGNIEKLLRKYKDKKVAIISFCDSFDHENEFILSKEKNFNEAAHNIFKYLRTIDSMDVDVILAEYLPEKDLGRAINDRLKRASA